MLTKTAIFRGFGYQNEGKFCIDTEEARKQLSQVSLGNPMGILLLRIYKHSEKTGNSIDS